MPIIETVKGVWMAIRRFIRKHSWMDLGCGV